MVMKNSRTVGAARRLRDRVRKAPSPIHGQGCFARVAFRAGEFIGTYEGPSAKRDGTYVLWVYEEGSPPVARSGRNLLRYLNHQPEGNAEFDGFDLYARCDITAGEEITFDYNGYLTDDDGVKKDDQDAKKT
jgi:SET domain-containing protein